MAVGVVGRHRCIPNAHANPQEEKAGASGLPLELSCRSEERIYISTYVHLSSQGIRQWPRCMRFVSVIVGEEREAED